ncbi:hypothetical protein [Devosia sp. SL43]|uniref:hypothetical protein n=1 Tax=Devosia sp. SL43 TaxID=2806348 RepID=UPI001F3E8574|nr:hypothetical protein [Devosia sp. SL43]UJW86964.1 hypothetical protein IM737_06895 [Devosia sp. SL43]
MAISSDYPKPITVNGYVCRNCDDVSKAKRFEDPAAKAGAETPIATDAVSFGGSLAGRRTVAAAAQAEPLRLTLDRYA